MKKPKTVSQLKKLADKVFSIYIRLKYADENGYVNCYTCNLRRYYKDRMQCGHFVSRSHLILRYDERNCRPQEIGCNVFGKGKIPEFGFRLESESPGITAELFKESQKIIPSFNYQAIIDKYGKLARKLEKSKGTGGNVLDF